LFLTRSGGEAVLELHGQPGIMQQDRKPDAMGTSAGRDYWAFDEQEFAARDPPPGKRAAGLHLRLARRWATEWRGTPARRDGGPAADAGGRAPPGAELTLPASAPRRGLQRRPPAPLQRRHRQHRRPGGP